MTLVPGKLQNVFEVIIDGIENFQVEMMGEEGRQYFPLIATIGIYVFICNVMGLVPGLLSPTANINTTLSVALVTFVRHPLRGHQISRLQVHQAFHRVVSALWRL